MTRARLYVPPTGKGNSLLCGKHTIQPARPEKAEKESRRHAAPLGFVCEEKAQVNRFVPAKTTEPANIIGPQVPTFLVTFDLCLVSVTKGKTT